MKDELQIKIEDVHPPIIPSELPTTPIGLMHSAHHDLPHVEGHEVEQLLAGIESEQNLSGGVSVDHYPNLQTSGMHAPPHTHQSVIVQSSLDELQAPPPPMSVKSPILSPTATHPDPFKTVFGEDMEDMRPTGSFAQRVDAQKQLKKWEADEKLGNEATISPVLFANMEHREELLSKYKGHFILFLVNDFYRFRTK